jgi:hypothetical protein
MKKNLVDVIIMKWVAQSEVRIPGKDKNLQNIQTGFEVHPTSY